MLALVIVLAWFACGTISAGFDFADNQGRWPSLAKEGRRKDLGDAFLMGLAGGPFALVVVFFSSGFGEHGWRLR